MEEKDRDEQELKAFIGKMHEFQMEQIPPQNALERECPMSEAFFAKMERLMKRQQKKEKQKAARNAFLAAAASVVLLLLLSRTQAFVDAGEALVWSYLDQAVFQFEWKTQASHVERHTMRYVPDGYKLLSDKYYGICGYQVYANQEDDRLCFYYMLIDVTLEIEKENKEFLTRTNGQEAVYYLKAEKGEESHMIWGDRNRAVKFHLAGTLSEESFQKVREGVAEAEE